jgi:hypothetical protein
VTALTDSLLVQFPDWSPHRPSLYHLQYTLHVIGDRNPANNKRSMSVQAAFNKDIRIKQILAPLAGAFVTLPVSPEIIIENSGVEKISELEAICEIKDRNGALVYRNRSTVFECKSQEQRTLTFAGWSPEGENPLTVQFQLVLTGDEYLSNNVLSIVINRKTAVTTDGRTAPDEFRLAANYPNPFNSQTTIPIHIPEDGRLLVRICNSTGSIIRTWIEECVAGEKRIGWDGTDEVHRAVSSGVYVCQVICYDRNGITLQQAAVKMVLLK